MDYSIYMGPWDVVEWQTPADNGWLTDEVFRPGEILFDLGPDEMLSEYDRCNGTLHRTGYSIDNASGVIDAFDSFGYRFGETVDGSIWLYVLGPVDGTVVARQRMVRPVFYPQLPF